LGDKSSISPQDPETKRKKTKKPAETCRKNKTFAVKHLPKNENRNPSLRRKNIKEE
jgi:hypothetical protein